jgi:SpoVK/Ycf46/Vps4 family AAA+-type ATPase
MALFMSEAERRRDARRRRRRILREVQNAVDAARAKRNEILKRRADEWAAARVSLSKGDEADARRRLESVRTDDAALRRLDVRLSRFEALEREMECADADAAFDEASASLARFIKEPEDNKAVEMAPPPTVDELLAALAKEPLVDQDGSASGRPKPPPMSPPLREDGESESSAKWIATKPDSVHLDDVIGLEDAKAVVMDALVNPVNHPDIYKTLKVAPGTGLLLYGPPGTGKTLFAKAVANEMDMPFMDVRCDKLKSKYVGETEKNVAEMFRAARALKRCVLFLDECNAILARRGDQKVCMVEQFLVELDGFAASDAQLFVLMATNLPWTLDSAITRSGRLSESVYVGLPDEAARRKLIGLAFKDVPLAADVDLGRLAPLTEGFSGADLAAKGGLCHKAKTYAVRRWVARRSASGEAKDGPEWNAVEPVSWADVEKALSEIVPVAKSAADIVARNRNFSLKKEV